MINTLAVIGGLSLCAVGLAVFYRKLFSKDMFHFGLVLLILLPFIFCTRTAVYSGVMVYGDTAIGFPLVYAYGQSDAGLARFSALKLIADTVIGLAVGLAVVLAIKKGEPRQVGGSE